MVKPNNYKVIDFHENYYFTISKMEDLQKQQNENDSAYNPNQGKSPYES